MAISKLVVMKVLVTIGRVLYQIMNYARGSFVSILKI